MGPGAGRRAESAFGTGAEPPDKAARRGVQAAGLTSVGEFRSVGVPVAVGTSSATIAAANVDRVGIYIGCTEHGNVETENEVYEISKFDYDTKVWTHHHNPRTVANNPAGEISLNMGITGPHYTIGAACAAGNAGIIMLTADSAAKMAPVMQNLESAFASSDAFMS